MARTKVLFLLNVDLFPFRFSLNESKKECAIGTKRLIFFNFKLSLANKKMFKLKVLLLQIAYVILIFNKNVLASALLQSNLFHLNFHVDAII